MAKAGLTGLAIGLTAYSGMLGAKVARQGHKGDMAEGATEPGAQTSTKTTMAQRQLKAIQWAIPLVTGTLVVLGAQQGEQQRPLAGWMRSMRRH